MHALFQISRGLLILTEKGASTVAFILFQTNLKSLQMLMCIGK
jgi:hypothetical protein